MVLVRTHDPPDIVEGVQLVDVVVNVFLTGWNQSASGSLAALDAANNNVEASESRIARFRHQTRKFLRKFFRVGSDTGSVLNY